VSIISSIQMHPWSESSSPPRSSSIKLLSVIGSLASSFLRKPLFLIKSFTIFLVGYPKETYSLTILIYIIAVGSALTKTALLISLRPNSLRIFYAYGVVVLFLPLILITSKSTFSFTRILGSTLDAYPLSLASNLAAALEQRSMLFLFRL